MGLLPWLPIILFLLANFKSLPLVWHLRLFTFLFQSRNWRAISDTHTESQVKSTEDEPTQQPLPLLFKPQIMHTRSPLLEIDLFLHKSNASFFTDVDVARSHLVASLIGFDTIRHAPTQLLPHLNGSTVKQGVAWERLSSARKTKPRGNRNMLAIVLAGVQATFRREIKPYQKYNVWTRVLTWDEKSVWFGSWFVHSEKLRHARKDFALHGERGGVGHKNAEVTREQAEKAVLAVIVSRNVFKIGRERVQPKQLWEAKRLVISGMDQVVEKERLRGWKAVTESDQATLMDIWVDMAASKERVGILAEYSDVWAWAWA